MSIPTKSHLRRDFHHFQIRREIGFGGMANVYEAFQTDLRRIVALKVIPFANVATEHDRIRFLREVKTTAQLEHARIVRVFESGEIDNQLYYSMPYFAAGSAADRLQRTPMTSETAAKFGLQIADAMQYAHENQIIHRDIKPSNVLIDDSGEPLISDFGLSRPIEEDSSLTRFGYPLGSIGYMSPEQASGDLENVNEASDIFSIGATLYTFLTRRPACGGLSTPISIKNTIEAAPIPPRQLNRSVPRDLQTICMKCLEKRSEQRYSSAQHLADDLGRFLNGKPILARPTPTFVRTWRWVKRHKSIVGFFASFCLAMIALVVLIAYLILVARSESNSFDKEIQLPDEMLAKQVDDQSDRRLVLNLRSNGKVMYHTKEIETKNLTELRRLLYKTFPESSPSEISIQICAHKDTDTGLVQGLIAACKKVDVNSFSLRVREEDDSN